MKSLMLFLHRILQDLGMLCGTSTSLDYKMIEARVEHEGMSFLTITLTNFGSDLQKGLDRGYVAHDLFQGFSWTGGLPRFLSGFLELVFDRDSGVLLDCPSTDAIFAVRQITLMFGKMKLPCSDARVKAAVAQYVETEQEVRVADASLEPSRLEEFQRIGRLLWADMLSTVDKAVFDGTVIPKHGPGVTADRLLGNQKWVQTEWPERLNEIFPFGEYLYSSPRFLSEEPGLLFLTPGQERPVKVITVPKTLKTPRIIAVEPTAMQYVQQGLHALIQDAIEADDLASQLIGYRSQVPNQELARKGSLTGSLATLDLSEASDRVSNQHVRALLSNHPHLASGVDACRSRKADVPGHGVIRLAKFASMGSALCFPFEAMVFCTVVLLGIEREKGRPLKRSDIKSLCGKVRVYGDDIIVPVDYVSSVVRELEAFGFKVNRSKSFWSGKFRESCGRDYYGGVDVTITRLRGIFPTRREHAREIESTVATRNQLYSAGLWGSCAFLDRMLEGIIPYPRVDQASPVLGRHSFLAGYDRQFGRWDRRLQRPLVKGVVVVGALPVSKLEGASALLKCLTLAANADRNPSEMPITDVRHLERAGRPHTVNTKVGWYCPITWGSVG